MLLMGSWIVELNAVEYVLNGDFQHGTMEITCFSPQPIFTSFTQDNTQQKGHKHIVGKLN
jgi:hypothetical protein